MLEDLQLISFEIGASCNMSRKHPWCPSNDATRYADSTTLPATVPHMLGWLASCMDAGFSGCVAMHYYCEPLMWPQRCRALSDGVHALGLRTLLWSNGTMPMEDGVFDVVLRTPYEPQGYGKAVALRPDDRLKIYEQEPAEQGAPCYRPSMLEMPVNYFGDLRMCCADWRGAASVGNISRDDHQNLLQTWKRVGQLAITSELEVCRRCLALPVSPALADKGYKLCTD